MRDLKKELSEHDYQRFFGNEGVWRNDNHPEEHGQSATVSTHVINATDVLKSGKHTRLKIRHITGFHGKGFMPACVSRFGGSSATGQRHYGTNQEAYDKAVVDGRKTVAKMDKEWDTHTEEMKKTYPDKDWDNYPDLDDIPENHGSDVFRSYNDIQKEKKESGLVGVSIDEIESNNKTIPELEKLWKQLGDIPVNNDGELDEPFLHFEKGTDRMDVWHWFESCNIEFVAADMMGCTK